MRILWFNSTPPKQAYSIFGFEGACYGGSWVDAMLEKASTLVELGLAFFFWGIKEVEIKKSDNITYYAIPSATPDLRETNEAVCNNIKRVYHDFSPDIMHIFGTERPHTLDVLKITDIKTSVISITGLVSIYSLHYYAGLDSKVIRRKTIRDICKGGIAKQKRIFDKYAVTEIAALKCAKHVIGRTTWDKACVTQINPDINYNFCNEMLRPSFYDNKWAVEKCVRHSIFVSAGNYPLKGVHQALEALVIIKKVYKDVRLTVAGSNIVAFSSLRDKLAITSYGNYIRKKISEYGLEDNVTFIGPQDEDGMLQNYLKTNVFALPSSIENSPNSLGEAMALGVPCVASCVGGVQDMLTDREDGFIYPFDAPYMLAHYIIKLFDDDELARTFSLNARSHAMRTHNRKTISDDLFGIYRKIMEEAQRQE